MAQAVKKAPPRKATAKRAPEKVDPLGALYPKGTRLWWFTTSDGTRIPFPHFSSLDAPPRRFFWELDQQPTLFQGFAWMRWAKVPTTIQSVVVDLPDADYDALFDAWFAEADLTAGE